MAASDSSFLLQQAVELHQQGAIAEASRRYADIILREPRNADALYLLGLAHCHLGEFPDAISRLHKAVSVAPTHAAAHNTLSMALRETGRLEEALASCNVAIAIEPGFAEAHANRGDILQDLHRPQEALDAYDRTLALSPDFVPAWVNRGFVLQQFDRHQEAVASYDRATHLAPELAEAWLNRSKALHALGHWDDALASCDRAIVVQPQFAPAFLARGLLLKDRGRFEDAVSCFDRALALQPAWAEALLERASAQQRLGDIEAALASCEQALAARPDWIAAWRLQNTLLHDAGRLDDALASTDRALALMPDNAECHAWRGAVLIKLNRPAEALAAYDRSQAIDPTRGTSHVDRGLALHALARFDEAWAAFEQGIRFDGDNPHVQFVVGLMDLLHGRWLQGFARYERRLDVPHLNFLHRRLLLLGGDIEQRFASSPGGREMRHYPRWTGEAPTGDPIMLETEQGIGDTIQFARFAAHLARLGHRVQILTLPRIAPLLRCVPGVEAVLSDASALERDPKHWLPLLSVPHVLKTTPANIPFDVPWLTADADRLEHWKQRLGNGGFKIGIAWQGNAQNWIDGGRSIPLTAFKAVADIPDVRLISLQMRPGAEQIDRVDFGARIERVLEESNPGPDTLLDTAALVAALDLVITPDSMLSHLSGALGRPTFVVLRRIPSWRWLLDREDSPWYRTARLFRQQQEADWTPVFDRVAEAIRLLAARSG